MTEPASMWKVKDPYLQLENVADSGSILGLGQSAQDCPIIFQAVCEWTSPCQMFDGFVLKAFDNLYPTDLTVFPMHLIQIKSIHETT